MSAPTAVKMRRPRSAKSLWLVAALLGAAWSWMALTPDRATPAPSATAAPAPSTPPPATPAAAAAPEKDHCLSCHVETGTAPAGLYKQDVHHLNGVTCADCHGGDPTSDDPEVAMNKAHGFMGVPAKRDIPRLCGKCHGSAASFFRAKFHLKNVLDDFTASAHGQALAGNDRGPTCVSCHGIHSIARVKDPQSPVYPLHVTATCASCHSKAEYMRDFNPRLPVDQLEKYHTSVHGKLNASGDPKPATCVSCHSNHLVLQVKDPRSSVYPTRIPGTCAKCHSDKAYMAQYHIPTNQYEGYRQSVHGIALLKNSDLNAPACNSCHGNHGASPPGVGSVPAVCGSCHQANADLYGRSAHRKEFEEKSLPGCVVCHSNHLVRPPTDALVGTSPPAPCAGCHHPGDLNASAASIVRIRGVLDSLTRGRSEAEDVLEHAEALGMDVSDARYSLKDVNQASVQTRVAIHSFHATELVAAAAPGLKAIVGAKKAGLEAVHEYRFRREGLVVSTLIVTLVSVLLYLKIRQIERGQRNEGE